MICMALFSSGSGSFSDAATGGRSHFMLVDLDRYRRIPENADIHADRRRALAFDPLAKIGQFVGFGVEGSDHQDGGIACHVMSPRLESSRLALPGAVCLHHDTRADGLPGRYNR